MSLQSGANEVSSQLKGSFNVGPRFDPDQQSSVELFARHVPIGLAAELAPACHGLRVAGCMEEDFPLAFFPRLLSKAQSNPVPPGTSTAPKGAVGVLKTRLHVPVT